MTLLGPPTSPFPPSGPDDPMFKTWTSSRQTPGTQWTVPHRVPRVAHEWPTNRNGPYTDQARVYDPGAPATERASVPSVNHQTSAKILDHGPLPTRTCTRGTIPPPDRPYANSTDTMCVQYLQAIRCACSHVDITDDTILLQCIQPHCATSATHQINCWGLLCCLSCSQFPNHIGTFVVRTSYGLCSICRLAEELTQPDMASHE